MYYFNIVMTFFVLQDIEYNISPKNLKLSFSTNDDYENEKILNPSLRKYINNVKSLISKYDRQWNIYKKYTYPYEFIHTNIPDLSLTISKIKPISRAFYKLIEIYNLNNILNKSEPIQTFHLAEGPGGFIEATAFLRNNKQDKYYGMTLIKENNAKVPNWKKIKNLFNNYENINIIYGEDNTGDLFNHKNLKYCNHHFKNSMDIITGDGGFDFSDDFNNQEKNVTRLILTQVAYAITMQKRGGSFILKIFDIFQNVTLQIIYLLSCFYGKVVIMKPNTSRYANSEKYLVCKFFKYDSSKEITHKFINILKILENIDFKKYALTNIIDIPIQFYYLSRIKEINATLGHKQIDNILNTIKLINFKDKTNKINTLKTTNIQKCITWCIKNNIPYTKNYEYRNTFLGYKTKEL